MRQRELTNSCNIPLTSSLQGVKISPNNKIMAAKSTTCSPEPRTESHSSTGDCSQGGLVVPNAPQTS